MSRTESCAVLKPERLHAAPLHAVTQVYAVAAPCRTPRARHRGGAGLFEWTTGERARPPRRAPRRTGVVQVEVEALPREQLLVRALLDDAAVVHHEDGVGVADGGQPVRDHEARAVLHQLRHGLLDQHLGTRVDRAGRLVEDEDLRIGQERAGDRQQLLLALRDVGRVVVEHRVVAVRQRAHEVVDVGRLGRGARSRSSVAPSRP